MAAAGVPRVLLGLRNWSGAEGWAVGCGPSEADRRCGTVPERPSARVRPGLTKSLAYRAFK